MKQNWWLIAKLIFQYAGVGEFIEIAIEIWRREKKKSESVTHAVIKITIMTLFLSALWPPNNHIEKFWFYYGCLKLAMGPFSTKNSITFNYISLFFFPRSYLMVCLLIHEIWWHLLGQGTRWNHLWNCGIVAWNLVKLFKM